MSDEPLTLKVLAEFHREVILPDMRRVAAETESRLVNRIQTSEDAVLKRIGDLETEYQAIKVGLKRVEDRLDGVEERLKIVESRLESIEGRLESVEGRLETIEGRLDVVEADLRRLEERLSRVEKRLDDVVGDLPGYATRAEFRELRSSVEKLQARIAALERRADPS